MKEQGVEEILFRAGQLNAQLPKHQQMRINQWIKKLSDQSTGNPLWKKNVQAYSILLLNMIQDGTILEPFSKMPPQGFLPQLPQHMVCSVRRSINGSSTKTRKEPSPSVLTDPAFSSTSDKCVQTERYGAFSDWTRIWKHTFNKMKCDLDEKKALSSAMEVEIQELKTLVGALKLSLEVAERENTEMKSHYEAKLQYIQSSHALEMESMHKKRCRKQADLDEKQSHLVHSRKPSSSFLDYIDNFFEETDHIAQTSLSGIPPLYYCIIMSDPRRPNDQHSFVREKTDPNELSSTDHFSMISLLLGLLGYSMQLKLVAWLAVSFVGASFANTRAVDLDVKQLSMSMMFATMALVSIYTDEFHPS